MKIHISKDEFISSIKEQYKLKGSKVTIYELIEVFKLSYSTISSYIKQYNLFDYVKINLHRKIQHYDIWNNDNKFIEYIKHEYEQNGPLTLSLLKKTFIDNDSVIKKKLIQLNLLNYFKIRENNYRHIQHYDIWSDDDKFIEYIKSQYNKKGILKSSDLEKYFSVCDSSIRTRVKRLNLLDYVYIRKHTQKIIKHPDIWSDDNKFIQFIIDSYNKKGLFLVMTEIALHFNVCPHRVRLKITRLNLLNYFYIQQSNLEIDFKSFLEKYNIEYKQYDKSILGGNKEIDFLCGNIGFEINDIATHNSQSVKTDGYKHPKYHLEKTLLAQQNNVKLIHIWEWELRNELIWSKLSQWILNELNGNKVKVDLSQCSICNINQSIANQFFNLYDIDEIKKYDYYIGIYYDNELICVLSINKTGESHIVLKYNYLLSDDQKLLLNLCERIGISKLISKCDLSKDNGDTLKQLGFILVDSIEPNVIWCNNKMETFKEQSTNCVPIYNCGYNVFELSKDKEEKIIYNV